jgi:hypothetical protein
VKKRDETGEPVNRRMRSSSFRSPALQFARFPGYTIVRLSLVLYRWKSRSAAAFRLKPEATHALVLLRHVVSPPSYATGARPRRNRTRGDEVGASRLSSRSVASGWCRTGRPTRRAGDSRDKRFVPSTEWGYPHPSAPSPRAGDPRLSGDRTRSRSGGDQVRGTGLLQISSQLHTGAGRWGKWRSPRTHRVHCVCVGSFCVGRGLQTPASQRHGLMGFNCFSVS